MKLTKELFEEGCKFKVIEDKEYEYEYEFCYLNKVSSYIQKDYMGDFKKYCVIDSYMCSVYKTYFKVYFTFFDITYSKKIYYRDCTVVE